MDSTVVYCFLEKDGSLFVGTDKGVVGTTDGGGSWPPFGLKEFDGLHVQSLASSNKALYAGTDVGMFISPDPSSPDTSPNYDLGLRIWDQADFDLPDKDISSLVVKGSFLFVGTSRGIFFRPLTNSRWTAEDCNQPFGYVNSLCDAQLYRDSIILVGSSEGAFVVSSHIPGCGDLNYDLIDSQGHASQVFGFAVDAHGNNIFAGTSSRGVLLSTDFGEHWSEINEGLGMLRVTSLTIYKLNLFIGTNNGIYCRPLSEIEAH